MKNKIISLFYISVALVIAGCAKNHTANNEANTFTRPLSGCSDRYEPIQSAAVKYLCYDSNLYSQNSSRYERRSDNFLGNVKTSIKDVFPDWASQSINYNVTKLINENGFRCILSDLKLITYDCIAPISISVSSHPAGILKADYQLYDIIIRVNAMGVVAAGLAEGNKLNIRPREFIVGFV